MLITDQRASQGEAFQTSKVLDLLEETGPRNPQASYYRARYYDQNVGRFITEDPVGFDAGPNFYRYVRNTPILLIDPTGLQISYGRPDPRKNTIVCDGPGKLRVQFGYPETLGGPKEQKCLIDCARVHEESHIKDTLAANPKVCNGQVDGAIPRFPTANTAASEITASNAELDCLRDKLEHGCKKEGCGSIILNRIQDVEAYRNGFQNKH